MNPKIVIAFVSGAVLASGIVFLAVRQELEPKPVIQPVPISKPAPQKTPPTTVPSPVRAAVPPAPQPAETRHSVPVKEHLSRTPIREKPSPLAPRNRQGEDAVIAMNQVSPVQADQAPPVQAQPPVVAQVETQPPAPVAPPPPQPPAPPENISTSHPEPDTNAPPTVTIAAGTILPVRIGETITASHYKTGDTFLATLDRQLVVDGWVIAQRGARLEGRVVQSTNGNSGSHLEIELTKLSLDDGQHIHLHTQSFKKDGSSSTGNDVAKVAAGAAIGTAIGAMAGGGKGAAIGAGVGAAAGAAGAAMTHAKPAEIPVETRISFHVTDAVTVTERLN